MKVYVRHIRAAKICMKGSRMWFERHGYSWNDFLTNGIAVEIVEATGCPIAARAVAEVYREAERGR